MTWEQREKNVGLVYKEKWSSLFKTIYPTFVDATAGTVGGAACVAVGQPFDTAKTLLQIEATTPKLATTGLNNSVSTMQCLRWIYQNSGVKGLYAGSGAALAANVSENALLFMSFGHISKLVGNVLATSENQYVKQNEPLVRGAIAGSCAAVVASLALSPLEMIKIRVQVGHSGGTLGVLKDIFNKGGIREVFRGFGATILREVPGNLAFFGTYEQARASFAARPHIVASENAQILISGGLGGMMFWVVSLPLDAIKTTQQAFDQPTSIAETTRSIYNKQGIQGFYRGFVPVVSRAFFANAALFWGVEKTKYLLL